MENILPKFRMGGNPLRVALTGAGGFLGRQVIRCAIDYGISEVIAITSNTKELASSFSGGDRLTIVDIREFFDRKFSFAPDTIFINCLFPTNADGHKMADGLEKVYCCISRAKEAGVSAIVNVSSQSVYGSHRITPAREIDGLCLESSYAVGKYSSEAYCNYVFKGIPHTNIRLSSLIGVGYDTRITNRLIAQALNGEKIKIFGGMQRYSLLDVKDAARGIIEVARHLGNEWKEIYNLGCNESITLIDLVSLIADVLKQNGIQLFYEVTDGADERNSAIDCNRFMQDFEWSPTVSLRQSLGEILKEKLIEVG